MNGIKKIFNGEIARLSVGALLLCEKVFTMSDGEVVFTRGVMYIVTSTEQELVRIIDNTGRPHAMTASAITHFRWVAVLKKDFLKEFFIGAIK